MDKKIRNMQEVLRLKIRNAEAASIEVVPVEGGVEIVLLKKEPKKEEEPKKGGYKFNDNRKEAEKVADNMEILRNFCTRTKEEIGRYPTGQKECRAQLKKFWDFYSQKAESWKGTIQPEKLWARWMEGTRKPLLPRDEEE